jgi:outer membrane protein OmpA-like peptidoglycan-associated protein
MKAKRIYFIFTAITALFIGEAAAQAPAYRFSVENMWVINSRFSELSLRPYSDDVYILMSDRGGKDNYNKWTGGTAYDIYFIDRSDWNQVSRPQGLSTKYSDGPVSVFPDGSMIITHTNKRGKMNPATGLMVYEQNLSRAVLDGEIWSVSVYPGFTSEEHSFAHPALSDDGMMMFLAATLPDGYGGMDLYVSYLIGEEWSDPINLGPAVNTAGDESFPFLHPDGSLYFTSNGHAGYGGTDIFVTRKDGRKWEEPLNLGQPVNSAANESAIYFNDAMDRGFFSSDRINGKGDDDVYAVFVDKLYDVPVSRVEAEYNSGVFDPESGDNDDEKADPQEVSNAEVKAEEVDVPVETPVEIAVSAEEEAATVNTEEKEAEVAEVNGETVIVMETDTDVKEESVQVVQAAEENKERRRKKKDDPEVEVAEIILSGNLVEEKMPADEDEGQEAEQPGTGRDAGEGEAVSGAGEQADAGTEEVAMVADTDEEEEAVAGLDLVEPEAAVVEVAAEENVEYADALESEMATLDEYMAASGVKNIYFGMNSSRLDSKSEAMLDELAEVLLDYEGPALELHAHADATGDHNINIRLSELRARSVIQYLHKKGVSMSRMCYLAYGESELYLAQQADIALNRRVEFRLKDYRHKFLPLDDASRVEGFAYKQLPMLGERKYFVQMAALSDMRTFSTYKLQEYGAAICYYQGGLYKYVLGPFDTMEEASIELQKVRTDYRDAFIFKNE